LLLAGHSGRKETRSLHRPGIYAQTFVLEQDATSAPHVLWIDYVAGLAVRNALQIACGARAKRK